MTGELLPERKPFSAMFVCQGIANLARVLRDQEVSSASSSSSFAFVVLVVFLALLAPSSAVALLRARAAAAGHGPGGRTIRRRWAGRRAASTRPGTCQ